MAKLIQNADGTYTSAKDSGLPSTGGKLYQNADGTYSTVQETSKKSGWNYWLNRILSAPDVAAGLAYSQITPWKEKSESTYDKLRAQGKSVWEAAEETHEQLPGWEKFVNTVVNPIWYIPGTKIVSGVGKVAATGLKEVGLETLGKGIAKTTAVPLAVETKVNAAVGSVVKSALAPVKTSLLSTPAAKAAYAEIEARNKAIPSIIEKICQNIHAKPDDLNEVMEEFQFFDGGATLILKDSGLQARENIFKIASAACMPTTGRVLRLAMQNKGGIYKPAVRIWDTIARDNLYKNVNVACVRSADMYYAGEAGRIEDMLHGIFVAAGANEKGKAIGSTDPVARLFGLKTKAQGDPTACVTNIRAVDAEGKPLSSCINDIIENHEKYGAALTPQQHEVCEKINAASKEIKSWAVAHGNQDYLQYVDDAHLMRMGLGHYDPWDNEIEYWSGGKAQRSNRLVGGIPSDLKERIYKTQEEGLRFNVYYNPNPLECLQEEAKWIMRDTRNKTIKSMVESLNLKGELDPAFEVAVKESAKNLDDLKAVRGIVEKAATGEVTDEDIAKFLRMSPTDAEFSHFMQGSKTRRLLYERFEKRTPYARKRKEWHFVGGGAQYVSEGNQLMRTEPIISDKFAKYVSGMSKNPTGEDIEDIVGAKPWLPTDEQLSRWSSQPQKKLQQVTVETTGEKVTFTKATKAQYKAALELEADDMKPILDKMIKDGEDRVTNSQEALRLAKLELATTGAKEAELRMHPAFAGMVFDKDVAKQLNDALGVPSQRATNWANNIRALTSASKVLRTTTAALDYSAPFIQGLPMMGYDPIKWAELTLKQIRWSLNPEGFHEYMVQNKAITDMWRKYGLRAGQFEYFAGESTLTKYAGKVAGATGQNLIHQTYGRADIAFASYGEACRLELAKALQPMCKTEKDYFDAAKLINSMTGSMNYATYGIGAAQQAFESTGLFAPMYLRSGWFLMGNTLSGGLVGATARDAMGHFMAAGTLFYYSACEATGQEPDLDPTSRGFMKLKINGQTVSLGGNVVAMARFAGDNLAFEEKIRGKVKSGMSAGEIISSTIGDFSRKEGETQQEWIARVRTDVPFLKYVAGRSSPVTSFISEIGTGVDYYGQELEHPSQYAAWLASKTLPMAISPLVSQKLKGEKSPGIIGAAAGVMGLNSYPENKSDQAMDIKDTYSLQQYNVKWNELDKYHQQLLRVQHQDIIDAENEAKESWVVGLSGRIQQQWREDTDAVSKNYQANLVNINAKYQDGVISAYEARQEIVDAQKARADEYKIIKNDPKYKDLYDRLETNGKLILENVEPSKLFDVAKWYYDDMVYNNPNLYDKYGDYQYGKAEKAKEAWAAMFQQYPDIIDEMKAWQQLSHANDPYIVQEYNKAKEVMSPYFALHDQILETAGMLYLSDKLDEYLISHPALTDKQVKYLRKKLGIQIALDMVADMKKNMRETNPQIQYYYQMFYSQ